MYNKEIKSIREERNLTQKEVSEATGIPQNTISWIESTKANGTPNIEQCVKLADFYGITIDELIGRETPKIEKSNTPQINAKYYKCKF